MSTPTEQNRVRPLGPSQHELAERLERLEYAVLLLAKHVGGTGWDRPLQEVLDAIELAESDVTDAEGGDD